MTDTRIPQVVILPACQAQIDADPEAQKALRGLKETLLNAMQGVQDGRYPTFEDACEAMTGERPRAVLPPNPPKHGYFLCIRPNPQGDGFMAVITDGCPQYGHTPIEILDVEIFQTEAEAHQWFNDTCLTLPWRTDNGDDNAIQS